MSIVLLSRYPSHISSPYKDEWESKLGELLAELPIVLDDDEEMERKRRVSVEEIRAMVASRCMELCHGTNGPDRRLDLESTKQGFLDHLTKLKEIHGPDMVFGPCPCSQTSEKQGGDLKRSSTSQSLQSDSTSSAASTDSSVKHKLFYLCKEGTVWTVVQATLVVQLLVLRVVPPKHPKHLVHAHNVYIYILYIYMYYICVCISMCLLYTYIWSIQISANISIYIYTWIDVVHTHTCIYICIYIYTYYIYVCVWC